MPKWATVLIALAVVLAINLMSPGRSVSSSSGGDREVGRDRDLPRGPGWLLVIGGFSIGTKRPGSRTCEQPGWFLAGSGDYAWYGPILVMSACVRLRGHRDGRRGGR